MSSIPTKNRANCHFNHQSTLHPSETDSDAVISFLPLNIGPVIADSDKKLTMHNSFKIRHIKKRFIPADELSAHFFHIFDLLLGDRMVGLKRTDRVKNFNTSSLKRGSRSAVED